MTIGRFIIYNRDFKILVDYLVLCYTRTKLNRYAIHPCEIGDNSLNRFLKKNFCYDYPEYWYGLFQSLPRVLKVFFLVMRNFQDKILRREEYSILDNICQIRNAFTTKHILSGKWFSVKSKKIISGKIIHNNNNYYNSSNIQALQLT